MRKQLLNNPVILMAIDADLKMWISKYGWEDKGDSVFITNQEELVKTKKITEKISFDSK